MRLHTEYWTRWQKFRNVKYSYNLGNRNERPKDYFKLFKIQSFQEFMMKSTQKPE